MSWSVIIPTVLPVSGSITEALEYLRRGHTLDDKAKRFFRIRELRLLQTELICGPFNSFDALTHHLRYRHPFKGIDGILTAQVIAAAAQSLGENRTAL